VITLFQVFHVKKPTVGVLDCFAPWCTIRNVHIGSEKQIYFSYDHHGKNMCKLLIYVVNDGHKLNCGELT
jgi:hypothetical protein